MNYDEQNLEINHRISEIDTEIQILQELYRRTPLYGYDSIEIKKNLDYKLAILEGERERLIKKLNETPQQRKWSNLKDTGTNALEKIVDSLPDFPEHVSGRVYRDTNDGCLKWWLILFVISAIVFAIIITIKGEWDMFF